MCRAVILGPNLMCNKCYLLAQYSITQYLSAKTSLIQLHYGYAVTVTAVRGLIPPIDQMFNDQPTMLSALFGGVSQYKELPNDTSADSYLVPASKTLLPLAKRLRKCENCKDYFCLYYFVQF